MKEVLRERLEPVDDVARQGSRSRNQRNAINPEPCTLQARGVVTRSREIPRHASVPINAAAIQSLNQCRLDLAYTAMASAFGHEAPTGFQRAVHGGDHGIGTFYPVQHRVAEHRIELFPERERFGIHHVCIQPKHSRSLDLRSAGIDRDDLTLQIDELFRERPVSTTQVENPFASPGCQRLQDRRSQVGHKARIARVGGGVPGLR